MNMRTITFNELRKIKDSLPSGSMHRIADELVACVKKDMSPHLCFVNVHVRVFFILCKTFGKNRNLE